MQGSISGHSLVLDTALCLLLQLERLYSMSLCSRDDCVRILSRYQWNLEPASRCLLRLTREDRSPAPADRERERP